MTPDRWTRIKVLFQAALARSPADRVSFLGDVCGDDEALRTEVMRLLAAHDQADRFIEEPPMVVVAATDRFSSMAGRV